MFKGLVFTCTNTAIVSKDSEVDLDPLDHYKQYIPLWKSIISPVTIDDLELSEKKRSEMVIINNNSIGNCIN